MIQVFVAEDHTLVREGLQSLLKLNPDMRIAGTASDGNQTLSMLRTIRPDVLLLDIRMPGRDGFQLMRALAEEGLSVPTLILTTFDEDSAFLESLRLGARGYLMKDVTMDTLTKAVRTVHSGGMVMNPGVTERVVRVLQKKQKQEDAPIEKLTDREIEVLRLMAAGCSNGEIGDFLNIGEGTVKNHVSNILGKLNARDRTRAVLKAIRSGIVP